MSGVATEATSDITEDVGIAVSCLRGGMVSLEAFKACLYEIVERAEPGDLPPCVFDLLDIKDRLDIQRQVDLPKHIRFPRFLTDKRIDAMIGLHHTLDPDAGNTSNISTGRASAALAECPEVRQRFDSLFGGRT